MTAGKISYNEKPRDKSWFSTVGYLQNDTPVNENLSVIEYIREESAYRLTGKKSSSQIEASINEVIKVLNLQNICDLNIAKISNIARESMNIAVDMICESNILILDEPFSCIDLEIGPKFMTILKEYAVSKNKIVIIALRQPNDEILSLFDNLLYLHKGALLYNGPLNEAEKALVCMGFSNSSSLPAYKFLSEVLSEKPLLDNCEQIIQTKKALVIAEEIKNKKIYEAADIKRGGSKLFYGGISWQHVVLNMKEMLRKDHRSMMNGHKLLQKILYLACLVLLGMFLWISCQKNIHFKIVPSFFHCVQVAYGGLIAAACVLSHGTFIHSNSKLTKHILKRRCYSTPTIVCSELLYNGALYFSFLALSFVMCFCIIIISGRPVTISLKELAVLIVYSIIPPVVQLFFSAFTSRPYALVLSAIVRLYMTYSHFYYFMAQKAFTLSDIYNLEALLAGKKPRFLRILLDKCYTILDKYVLSVFSPFKHFAIIQMHVFLSEMKSNSEILKRINLATYSMFNKNATSGGESSPLQIPEFVQSALSIVYKEAFSCMRWIYINNWDPRLIQNLRKAKSFDDFLSQIQDFVSKKLMFVSWDKYFSFSYLWILLVFQILATGFILFKRFAPDVRLRL
ncbi:ATP-binding cassette, subfamily G (WHITE), member 2 [Enteropsectra breve]|nr:ATP-binding cassette, subfamily G (WHITE), member 2 [Enteropsectra breve]